MTDREVLTILSQGQIHLEGQFVWGSNYTFLVEVEHALGRLRAVYKPSSGERPLWDFPDGTLAAREVAAWLTSEALGWRLVPPTVLRSEGPAGPGSLQQFLDLDPERHYFTFDDTQRSRLQPAAVFDVVVNNADRKGGHILLDGQDHIWLIDHGVCFHQEAKLRTVIWDFAGEPIPDSLLRAVEVFRNALHPGAAFAASLAGLLEPQELAALQSRAESILHQPRFPFPSEGRPYPWPLV